MQLGLRMRRRGWCWCLHQATLKPPYVTSRLSGCQHACNAEMLGYPLTSSTSSKSGRSSGMSLSSIAITCHQREGSRVVVAEAKPCKDVQDSSDSMHCRSCPNPTSQMVSMVVRSIQFLVARCRKTMAAQGMWASGFSTCGTLGLAEARKCRRFPWSCWSSPGICSLAALQPLRKGCSGGGKVLQLLAAHGEDGHQLVNGLRRQLRLPASLSFASEEVTSGLGRASAVHSAPPRRPPPPAQRPERSGARTWATRSRAFWRRESSLRAERALSERSSLVARALVAGWSAPSAGRRRWRRPARPEPGSRRPPRSEQPAASSEASEAGDRRSGAPAGASLGRRLSGIWFTMSTISGSATTYSHAQPTRNKQNDAVSSEKHQGPKGRGFAAEGA